MNNTKEMYYRIFNQLDAEVFTDTILEQGQQIIGERLKEIVSILDENYGSHRKSFDMGGFVLFFPTEESYKKLIDKIMEFYHLQNNLCEYEEIIGERAINNVEWHEKLWMLSSDDAITIIYPTEVSVNA